MNTVSADEQLDVVALGRFLDDHDLGSGAVRASRIGDGASNLTYLIERRGKRVVLRRPPPPPIPPSAHDMMREARVQIALRRAGLPVPEILAVCADDHVIGAPFYVMEALEGFVLSGELPPALDRSSARRALAEQLIDALVQLHAVDWQACGLEGLGRPSGYLDRQLHRWTSLWGQHATRELNIFGEIEQRLRSGVPDSPAATVVHGDFRLGNVMLGAGAPARIVSILDWEMATIGDPLADLGYLTATWSEPNCEGHPLLLTPATARPGFPSAAELADRYGSATGREVSHLRWYQGFALWKAAVFCEAMYRRFLQGERTDQFARSMGDGVPRLLEVARLRLDY